MCERAGRGLTLTAGDSFLVCSGAALELADCSWDLIAVQLQQDLLSECAAGELQLQAGEAADKHACSVGITAQCSHLCQALCCLLQCSRLTTNSFCSPVSWGMLHSKRMGMAQVLCTSKSSV